MKQWDWPGPSSSALYNWGLPHEYSVVSSRVFCRCLAPLLRSDDLLSASMLEVMEEEEATTSPSPAEEAMSPVEEPEPWEVWPTAVQAPNHLEEASEPKGDGSSWGDGHCTKAATTCTTRIQGATGCQIKATSPGGCWHTLRYTPGGSARPKLLRVYASGHHPKYLDGQVVIPLPDQGHLPDVLYI